MEKRGVIEPGRTPPEPSGHEPDNLHDKRADAGELEEHVTRRAAEAVEKGCTDFHQ